LDCANDVAARAKFAMVMCAIAVVRFMTVSPFSEASNLIAFNLLSAIHNAKVTRLLAFLQAFSRGAG
jgi:hypothetical protein